MAGENVFAGKLNYVRTYDFAPGVTVRTWAQLGFNASNVTIIYEGGGSSPKSWADGELSSMTGLKPNTGYRIVVPADMHVPEFDPPAGNGENILYLHDVDA